LREPSPASLTVLAERGGLVGFAHVVLGADPRWSALLDNLHVAAGSERRGIGSQLLARAAAGAERAAPGSGLHVWVLEQNRAAQAFYEALGGQRMGSRPVPAPGGVPGRLVGEPIKLLYAWPSAAAPAARAC
jgi:ribosomal protein S18 acetylase RimI-like enzyme